MHMPSHQQPSWAKWWRSCRTTCARGSFWHLQGGPTCLGHVKPDPPESAQSAQHSNTALQPDSSQESDQPKSPCMAPRASAFKQQGFSETVAARIEAPERGSTRSVYEAKWTIFTKRCLSNQVDFRAPPVNVLLYLFQFRKLQHSTIDGYRSAIADKRRNSPINVSKGENLSSPG